MATVRVLSSLVHVAWALAQGGRLGYGNDPRYNKSRCFETFPFPEADASQADAIRQLAESIDAHRKARQDATGVTLTDLYNAVEALRDGRTLTKKEQQASDDGYAHTLLDLHQRLDDAVLTAYGWPHDLTDAALLERLVALNETRRAEEAQGVVRYLRPAFQAPGETATQAGLALAAETKRADLPENGETDRAPWPDALPAQMQALRTRIATTDAPVTADEVAAHFDGARAPAVAQLLAALVELGLLHVDEGRYAA